MNYGLECMFKISLWRTTIPYCTLHVAIIYLDFCPPSVVLVFQANEKLSLEYHLVDSCHR